MIHDQDNEPQPEQKCHTLNAEQVCELIDVYLKSTMDATKVIKQEGFNGQKSQVFSIFKDLGIKSLRNQGIKSVQSDVVKKKLKDFFLRCNEKSKNSKRNGNNARSYLSTHSELLIVALI